jgi:uncharacterized NAD-dependent epimerase/dehydratase family protein
MTINPDQIPLSNWLPLTMKEARKKGWEELDVVLVTGDAYVDHPAFGSAVIGRIIESYGFKIAIIAQPNWQDDLEILKSLENLNLFWRDCREYGFNGE